MAGYENLGMAPAVDVHPGVPTIGSEQLYSGVRNIGDAHPHSSVLEVGAAFANSGVRRAVWTVVAYPDLLTTHLGTDVFPAASPDSLASHLGSGVPLVAWNGVSYPDVLTAHLNSGVTTSAQNGMAFLGSGVPAAAYTELFVAHLSSGGGVPPAARNGVAYTDWLRAHLGSAVLPAPQNAVAYPDGLGVVTAAADTGAVSYIIDVSEGAAADFGLEHLRTTRVAAAATEQGGSYYNSGMALPFAVQVSVDENRGGVFTEAFTERVLHGLPVLGLGVASVAVTGLTAGAAATPATAFGLFAMLVGGLSLATIRVLRA